MRSAWHHEREKRFQQTAFGNKKRTQRPPPGQITSNEEMKATKHQELKDLPAGTAGPAKPELALEAVIGAPGDVKLLLLLLLLLLWLLL
jgi:hypothetical protein